jgi:metal-responsive CopG/Arc/MetJ family transcriptional regulator
VVSAKVTDEELGMLDESVRRTGENQSEVIRRAIRHFFLNKVSRGKSDKPGE